MGFRVLPMPRQELVQREAGDLGDAGSTSASQACGSTSLSLAASIRVYIAGGTSRRHRSEPANSHARGQWQSPGHSAHIGQEVVVHYRWHPLYGRRVRLQHAASSALGGRFVQIEAEPGIVTVVAAWMLDPVACAGMEIGARAYRWTRSSNCIDSSASADFGEAPGTTRSSSRRSEMEQPARPDRRQRRPRAS